MQTVTIPKKLAAKDDLIVIPRKEYEELLAIKQFRSFIPTSAQKKVLLRAEKNLKKKKTLSYHELIKELGFAG